MNTSINFKIEKLLKEKGYPFELIIVGEIKEVPLNIPTVAEVVMWLYDKHEIWIVVNIAIDSTWYFELYNLKDKRNSEIVVPNDISDNHNSPTEAYSEAINYTLKNLIK